VPIGDLSRRDFSLLRLAMSRKIERGIFLLTDMP
jgi:hypothetical protein